MYCPQCGQQQVSDEVRYCPRCGLPLGTVARVVAGGGQLAGAEGGEARGLTPRQRGVGKGVLITAGGFLFGLIAVLLTLFKEDFFVLMPVALLVLTVGVMRILYARLLEEDAPPRGDDASRPGQPALDGAHARARELHAARAGAAPDLARGRAQTAEMVSPPSVAEGTTRLLGEDDK